MEAPDDDQNSANDKTANHTDDENTAETSNGARVSVINVADKTLGDNIKSMRNVSNYSFHDTSDTDSEALLNVDGNESLNNLGDPIQDSAEIDTLSKVSAALEQNRRKLAEYGLTESQIKELDDTGHRRTCAKKRTSGHPLNKQPFQTTLSTFPNLVPVYKFYHTEPWISRRMCITS